MTKAIHAHENDAQSFMSDPPNKREFRVILSPHLQDGAPDLVSVSTAEVWPEQVTPFHSHEYEDEIWYVITGQGKIRVGDEVFDVRPGSVVVAPARVSHCLINPYSWSLFKCLVIFTPAGPEEMFLPKEEAA